jgi:quercetin dioxygenase-like cupin family protein
MRTWLELTEGFPIRFDVQRMKADLERFHNSDAWLSHYDRGLSQGWRVIMLRSRNGDVSGPESQRPSWDYCDYRRTPYVDQLPYFREIMDQLKCPQGRMRISRLTPGAVINAHYDVGAAVSCLAFGQVRLHVPIVTNDRVTFFVGGEELRMQAGRLYYVNFSKRHSVRNDGDQARIHLVMDLKVNDWLAQYFPRPTAWEQLEFAAVRALWPNFWRVRRWHVNATRVFWKYYEGSRPQAVVQRIRRKTRAAT